ncbi:chemotaxis protein CheR [Maribrevibacterium harenarium]|uniref:Chemotaxis protein methyltransferase n=1 Tax=Maribrevibacterium harenarium TaxID=2589817 RepID=A0A501WZJ3_9GAMM|nr:CheR family methyltransferase [Maribrevibacterium harenarium]TPE51546.1 chemotaxis protein CheR [Maribrevibacterium harenarium]
MDREFAYTESDFNKVRSELRDLTGINLADSKISLVYSRLAPRVRKLGLTEIRQYLRYLETHADEQEHFINALTTNLTSFFREPHHFDLLKDFIASGERVERIWCAASSTGEEPYSIAMTLVNTFGSFDIKTRVVASDIDSNVLNTASLGVYPLQKVDTLENKKHFFLRGKGNNSGYAKVVPQLRQLLDFQRVNLLDENYPIKPDLDVIFCRNVMIYFDKDTQAKILKKLLSKLRPGGLYIAGHSENFNNFAELMQPVGRTAYVKR